MFKKKDNENEEPPVNAEYQRMITTNKDGEPLGQKKKPKERPEKAPGSFKRTMRGEKLCITLRKTEGPYFDEYQTWMKLNKASILALGYVPVRNYIGGFGTKYMKFVGFEKSPIMVWSEPEEGKEPELEIYDIRETAFTIYDYLKSDAQERALNSMRAKKFNSRSGGKWLVYMAIIGIALIGGFLYMSGRA